MISVYRARTSSPSGIPNSLRVRWMSRRNRSPSMRVVTRTFGTALKALRRNIMRSALTCVGIVIGIAAVIAMMEIGNGIAALNEKAIASLGANNLQVMHKKKDS